MAATKRSITVALSALGLLSLSGIGLLTGCENTSQKWHGTWEGDMKRLQSSAPDDVERTINLLRITILPDGTFEMLESGLSKSGTTRLDGDKAYLKVKKLLGQPIEQSGPGTQRENEDLVLEWGEDGTVVWHDPSGYGGVEVQLKRASQR